MYTSLRYCGVLWVMEGQYSKNGVLPPNITQQLEDAMRESLSFPKKVLQKRNSSPEEEFDDAKDNLPLP